MRRILFAFAVCLCSAVAAEEIVLDLSKESSIKYDETGLWVDIYNGSPLFTENFIMMHANPYDNYSQGFFPSKVTTIHGNATPDDQWGCMAKGGVAGEGSPFLGAAWSAYSDSPNNWSCMINNSSYWYAKGIYVCNNPYTYYSMQKGDGWGKKFEQGDWLKLVIHSLNQFFTEEAEPVEVYLADYRSENPEEWTMLDKWEWVDLTGLGLCSSFYFTMESSDTGDYGMNTPAYFCIDGLTVSTTPVASIDEVEVKANAYYNRAVDQLCVITEQATEVLVYAVNGTELMRATVEGNAAWDMSSYPVGVYVVRCGNHTIKVIK